MGLYCLKIPATRFIEIFAQETMITFRTQTGLPRRLRKIVRTSFDEERGYIEVIFEDKTTPPGKVKSSKTHTSTKSNPGRS